MGVEERYDYRTGRLPDGEDGFVGTVAEFPSLSWAAPTEKGALHGIRMVVREVLRDMAVCGETPPRPIRDMAARA